MKKTLITLLALAGVAMGADATSMNTALTEAVTLNGYQKGDSYELVYTVSAPWSKDGTVAQVTIANSYYLVANGPKGAGYLGFSSTSGSMSADPAWPTSTLVGGVHEYESDGLFYGWFSKLPTDGEQADGSASNIGDNAQITLNYNAQEHQLTVTLDRASGDSYICMNNVTLNDRPVFDTIEGAFVSFTSSPAPATPSTPAVPEPATATLSLLALAGLAMRRRRK